MSVDPATLTHEQVLATLTREQVLATAMADPIFVANLNRLKNGKGFGVNSIHAKVHGTQIAYDIPDVIVVVMYGAEVYPGQKSEPVQDYHLNGCTHLLVWITPVRLGEYWRIPTSKNQLYVGADGEVHLSRMSTGTPIVFNDDADEGNDFKTIAYKNRGVYVQSRPLPGSETYVHEAHVYLTVAELAAL